MCIVVVALCTIVVVLCVLLQLSCVYCCSRLVCIVVAVLCVLLLPYVYLSQYICMAVFTLDDILLARSQYLAGPATGHLDTCFSCIPCVYKQMLRWFPTFQAATILIIKQEFAH